MANCNCVYEPRAVKAGVSINDRPKKRKNLISRRAVVLAVSVISLAASIINPAARWGLEFFRFVDPAWLALILLGRPIFVGVYQSIVKAKKITVSVLISLAILGTVTLEIFRLVNLHDSSHHEGSYILAAAEIAFLMAVGGLLEDWTIKKTRAGIERLVSLAPKTVVVKRGANLTEIPVDEAVVGDIVVVKPGEMIAVDGVIIKGRSAVDQSTITGESVPVDKAEGDQVFGGTLNKAGALEIKVTKPPQDMTVNKLIELVTEAEGKRAPISRVADKWASRIVPAAVLLGVAASLFSYFVFNVSVLTAIIRGVTVLVVFCPCALALATPTAIAAGLGNAAQRGVLIKSGEALEVMARVDVVALDKTGTLTEGSIAVNGIKAYGIDQTEFLSLAAAAEKYSEHPIAKAIIAYAQGISDIKDADQTTSLPGIGVRALIDGSEVLVCRAAHLKEMNIDTAAADADIKEWLLSGNTVVAVCKNNTLVGVISLSDTLRAGAAETVGELEAMGIGTAMLTGDNAYTASKVANAVGISTVRHSFLPGDKLNEIEKMKSDGRSVCMVGDGVNDAPALAAADCSIAMGALGSDIAIETADAAVMSSDITRLPGLFTLSRHVMSTIKVNISLSIVINIFSVVLSTLGLLTPVTGALVHNAASILVVSNSALILMRRDKFVSAKKRR